MNGSDRNTSAARALVDEWVRAGVEESVLAPGSRSTPLALALAQHDRLRLSVFLDERSASFFAVGAAKASGRPVVVVCTSGTAAANLHPAVMEAWHSRTPLLVCTADRPPELRDTGAGQAVDQTKLFGGAVRWFVEVGDGGQAGGRYWRSVAARAWATAVGPPAGPVHLNCPFPEPLVPTGEPLVDGPGRPSGRPWTVSLPAPAVPSDDVVSELASWIDRTERGALVVGWGAGVSPAVADRFARAAGWPVLADAVSGARVGAHAVSAYDPLLRSAAFADRMRPELVVQVGAACTNRTVPAWLGADVPRVLVDPDGAWLDPHRGASLRVAADPGATLTAVAERLGCRSPRRAWIDGWLAAEVGARRVIDGLVDSWNEPFEGRVVRDVAGCLPQGATLVVGSSMPVRDAESFVAARTGLRWVANRGASGIDGFVSTILGVARVSSGPGPVVGLLGDLTFLHDAGGLLGAGRRGLDAVLVVLDNDGGGIFSFLPQAGHGEHFERLFGTPHGIDLRAVAAAYGVPAERVGTAADVVPAVLAAVEAGGVRLVVVPTDRATNVARHRQVWAAVAAREWP